ncbi:hypothetical protein, partial [uncultured Desulfovibrio sp.]|uniref:hypothetical protein n=1 Tax=uncultured Desulfovibrio sp. TaxID=167968 RepID=UPI00260F9DF9
PLRHAPVDVLPQGQAAPGRRSRHGRLTFAFFQPTCLRSASRNLRRLAARPVPDFAELGGIVFG